MPEDWILLALVNSNDRYGINLSDWYRRRPEELKISFGQFHKKIENMEKKNLIKRAKLVVGHHCLTDTGKKKALSIKNELNFKEYYSLISHFPEIELRDRVETIERFIMASLLLLLLYFIGNTPFPFFIVAFPTLMLVLGFLFAAFFAFSLVFFTLNTIRIAFYYVVTLEKETLWKYKEWLWNNKGKIIYPVPAVLIIILSYCIYMVGILSVEQIIGGYILAIIIEIVKEYKNVVAKILKLFSRFKR